MLRLMMSSHYNLPDGNVQISFSGGRTSAFMLHQILEANGDLPDRCQVMFANTGREMPQTLAFVHECSVRWNVPVVWLEYDRVNNRATYRVASWDNHSMYGEPFEMLVRRKKYLPNTVMRFCTTELKVLTMKRYLTKQLGWKRWSAAVGIRADESRRIKHDSKDCWSYWYPLADAGVTKRDIRDFWNSQPFDLQLENVNGATPLGNCDMCFLKSEKILANIAKTMPDKADWWIRMERETGSTFRKDRDLAAFTEFVGRQSDWVFDDESFFCQADGGECTG
jgi:3'-phosphoadenosine 5'-phosphosulfate sulfotransferase (PAPS reductase)/FAD synthetase